MSLYETFIEPFTTPFMQRALVVIAVFAICTACIGAWVNMRRIAFAAHATGHATFPALVVAAIFGWNGMLTSAVAAVALGAVLAVLHAHAELRSGAAVAIVLSASLALGAVLISNVSDPGVTLNGFLFGSLFGLDDAAVGTAIVVAIAAVAFTTLGLRALTQAAFDDDPSRRRRAVPADILLMISLAVTVAVGAQILGSLLVGAMVAIPAATARLVVTRIPPLLVGGGLISLVDGVAGLWIAARFDTPPGASIAAVACGVFVLVAIVSTMRSRAMRTIPT